MFIGKFNKSVIVTYIGTFSAMLGMWLAFNSHPTGAIITLMIAGICDLFDGKIARMCKNRTDEDKLFGVEIDSLADMVAFVVFPIVIAYTLGINNWYNIIFFTLFTICAITRLAYFNVSTNGDGPVKYYSGLPVTTTAIIFPAIYLLKNLITNQVIFNNIFGFSFLIIAFLFVYNFKIRKPTKNWWHITCCTLAVIASAILIYLKYWS